MNIQEYQKLAKRTCVNLGTDDLNRQHMLLGVISEIGEIADAYKKSVAYGKPLDRVNLLEEACGDVSWYIVNWATFCENELLKPYLDDGFIDDDEHTNEPVDYLFDFLKAMHFGKRQQLLNYWFTLCLRIGITEEEYYQGLQNNIDKLKVRYPEKFSNESALNRDLDSERTELEKE